MTIFQDEQGPRKRVVGPYEEAPPEDFYNRKHDAQDRLPINTTAFRETERKYKSRSELIDMSLVLDFDNPEKHNDIIKLHSILDNNKKKVYQIPSIPGFYYLPNYIKDDEKEYWIRRTFEEYLPHNSTNLDSYYRNEKDVVASFDFYNEYKIHGSTHSTTLYNLRTQSTEVINVEKIFKKIRWSILGYEYDWTKKEYNFDKKHRPFPKDLADYATDLVSRIGFMNYRPEAGIVNYYQPEDSLTGHVDRSEPNMNAPLVSLSLGLSAIFLIGGRDRNDPVIPILIKSGDALILSGECRNYFHGIPRILAAESTTVESNKEPYLKLIENSRININIRQVF